MKKLYTLLAFFVLFWSSLSGQGVSNPVIAPPSPNVSSLAKFGLVPVSNYTGVPSISIPLYTINEGNISLPISLDYHAGGFRVEEEASWAGLGWSLNAGGTITRILRDQDDLSSYGFFKGNEVPDLNNNNAYIYSNYNSDYKLVQNKIEGDPLSFFLNRIASRSYGLGEDGQPDLFIYNVAGRSGKFIIDKSKDSPGWPQIVHLSQEPVKIRLLGGPDALSYYFQITFEDGIVFTFQKAEIQELTPGHYIEGKGYYQPDGSYNIYKRTFISAWHLTSITSPGAGSGISFLYNTNESFLPSLPARTQSIKGHEIPYWSYSFTSTKQVYLKHIISSKEIITLNTEDRSDLQWNPESPTLRAQKIKNIIIREKDQRPVLNGKIIKRYNFNTSYFESGTNREGFLSNRLKLDALTEIKGNISNSYNFSYITRDGALSLQLPDKDSFAQDYWGFYNGMTQNDTHDYLLPYANIFITHYNNATIFAKREPNKDYVKACLLSQITYPTGGNINFEYETHTFRKEDIHNPYFSNVWNMDYGGGVRIKKISNFDKNGEEINIKRYLYEHPDSKQSWGRLMFAPIFNWRFYDWSATDGSNKSKVFFTSSSQFPVGGSAQGALVGYSKVLVLSGEEGDIIKSEYNYHNQPELNQSLFAFSVSLNGTMTPFSINAYNFIELNNAMTNTYTSPNIPNRTDPLNGKIKNEIHFKNLWEPIKTIEYRYISKEKKTSNGYIVDQYRDIGYFVIPFYIYPIYSEWIVLDKKIETVHGQEKNIVTEVNYFYENNAHKQLTKTIMQRSDGKKQIEISTYPSDYLGSGFIESLISRNILNKRIEKVKLLEEPNGNTTVTEGQITTYYNNGLPNKTYQLPLSAPQLLSLFRFSNMNKIGFPDLINKSVFNPNDSYEEKLTINSYNNARKPNQITINEYFVTSYDWGITGQNLVAEAKNVKQNEFFITDFEKNSGLLKGNHNVPHTGKYSFDGTFSCSTHFPKPSNGKKYILSYFQYQPSTKVWNYMQEDYDNQSLTGIIDDIRIYPEDAMVTTFIHHPLIGIKSKIDPAGTTTHYSYDESGRLKSVQDQNGYILTSYDYHYANSSIVDDGNQDNGEEITKPEIFHIEKNGRRVAIYFRAPESPTCTAEIVDQSGNSSRNSSGCYSPRYITLPEEGGTYKIRIISHVNGNDTESDYIIVEHP